MYPCYDISIREGHHHLTTLFVCWNYKSILAWTGWSIMQLRNISSIISWKPLMFICCLWNNYKRKNRFYFSVIRVMVTRIPSASVSVFLVLRIFMFDFLHPDIGDRSRLWLSCLGTSFYCSKPLYNYLALQSFDVEHTWWRLSQKCAVHTILPTFSFQGKVILLLFKLKLLTLITSFFHFVYTYIFLFN
jgi:hypothetical protein